MLTDCTPLRDLLSRVLARRSIAHRTLTRLAELLAQADALARRGHEVRWVVLVGPGLCELDSADGPVAAPAGSAAHRAAIEQLDAALARVPGHVDLVVFDDAMDGEALPWPGMQPRLRSPVPPRLFDVLRVIDDRSD